MPSNAAHYVLEQNSCLTTADKHNCSFIFLCDAHKKWWRSFLHSKCLSISDYFQITEHVSQTSLSLPNPQNKNKPDWALHYVRKWIFFSLRFSHEEQTERGTKRWRLPSLTLWSGRSITQFRSRMKANLPSDVHTTTARTDTQPALAHQTDPWQASNKPALISFACPLLSFSSLVYKSVSLNH